MSINQRAKDMWVSDLVEILEKRGREIIQLEREIIQLEREIIQLERENKKLKEKIETLELRLDNKEKLNEEYRKQLDGYKM